MPGAALPPETAAALLAAGVAKHADISGVTLRYDLCDHIQELEVLLPTGAPELPDEVHALSLCPSCLRLSKEGE